MSAYQFQFIRLCKVAESADASLVPAELATYQFGKANLTSSFPVSYWIEGWLIEPPRIGETVKVLRTSKNGVAIPGIFNSSQVTAIPSDDEFHTLNSIYRWHDVPLNGEDAACPLGYA